MKNATKQVEKSDKKDKRSENHSAVVDAYNEFMQNEGRVTLQMIAEKVDLPAGTVYNHLHREGLKTSGRAKS